jgi:hypothetical protein
MTAVTLRSAGGLRTARERTLALVAPFYDSERPRHRFELAPYRIGR